MHASPSPPALEDPPVDIDICGPLVRLRSGYDAALVKRLRGLPQARFDRDRAEWLVPARRPALVALATLVLELGDRARLTGAARRRLDRQGPGVIERRDGEFELSFAPHTRRLERVRQLPDRCYDSRLRRWRVAPTRAGALQLLALIAAREFVADHATAAELQRVAAAHDSVARLRRPRRALWSSVPNPPLAPRPHRSRLRTQPPPPRVGRGSRLVRARARGPDSPQGDSSALT